MLGRIAIGALIFTNALFPAQYDIVKSPVYFQPTVFLITNNELAIEETKDEPLEETCDNVASNIDTMTEISLPDNKNNGFKTYMDYRAITDTSSNQWGLQQEAYTDEYGIRKVGDYYCVALGSAFSTRIGDKFLIKLEDGQEFKAILADQKSDLHTDETNKYMQLSDDRINIVEFLVDTSQLEYMAKIMGDISYLSHGGFEGKIISIVKEGENSND